MAVRKNRNQRNKTSLVVAMLICAFSGAATLAHADFSNLSFARVESELSEQSRALAKLPDAWAKSAKSRADFALLKLNSARMSVNPAVENTHLNHACKALAEERAVLVDAQLNQAGSDELLEELIEQTFFHREVIGCVE